MSQRSVSKRLTDEELAKLSRDVEANALGAGVGDFLSAYERLVRCLQELVERRAAEAGQ